MVWQRIVFHLLLLQTLEHQELGLDGKLLLLSTLQPSGQMMKKPLHTFVRCPEMQRTAPSAAGNGNEGMKTIMLLLLLLLLLQVASGSIADAKAVAAAAGACNQLKL